MNKVLRQRRCVALLRMTVVVLLAVLLASMIPGVFAEGTDSFTIDEHAVFNDMSRSWLQGYEPSVSWDRMNLVLPIRADKAVSELSAQLLVQDETISPFKAQNMSAKVQRVEDELWALRFSLALFSDRVNGDYPCKVLLVGKDADGGERKAEIPLVIPIRDGMPNKEPLQLAIADAGSALSIGEDGLLALTITNPGQRVGYENLLLTVSDPSGDILPKELDTVAVGDLKPGESRELSFPVTVLAGARVAPHSLRLDFSGQSLGEDIRLSLCYTVTVRQEIRLEQGGLRMANSVVAGDSITASLPLMNMGKAEVRNAMVTICMPGITERQSVLVGTIQPGETKQAQLTVTAPKDALGSFDGTLIVSAEDNDGNGVSYEMPMSLTVEEAVKTNELTAQRTVKEKKPAVVIVLAIVSAALGALLIVQSILLHNKIHRLEEDRL